MQPNVIQFLAALSNERSLARFAQITLGNARPSAETDAADRLLRTAGVLIELPDGSLAVDAAAIRSMLTSVRDDHAGKRRSTRLASLPKRERERERVLRELASQILSGSERVPESVLTERLDPLVEDVAMVRRAMIDGGLLRRDASGAEYWIAQP